MGLVIWILRRAICINVAKLKLKGEAVRFKVASFRMPLPRRSQSIEGRRRIKIWPLLVFAVFAVIYYQTNQEVVPITGRSQLVDISKQQEMALGLQSYNSILRQSQVIRSGDAYEMLQRVAGRIAKVTGESEFEWDFNLIKSDEPNAFALPGGKVAVHTGILPIAKNDDGLAVILGHEIAHAIARHGAERMAHQKLNQWGSMAVGVAIGEMSEQDQRLIFGAFGLGSQFGIMLPFSRKHESEADYMGLVYVARACYNPLEAPLLWQRMQQANSGRAPLEFLSTHPSAATRIEQFREWMPEALAIKSSECKL